MMLASELFGKEQRRDEDGRIILGRKDQGCRHCGKVEMKYASNGRVVLYHPGAECCVQAIDDQIRHRKGEIDDLNKQVGAKKTALELLAQETRMYDRDSKSTEATKAFYRLEMAEMQYQNSLKTIEGRIIEVSAEITDLKAKRGELSA